jgi:hypothetical protein
MQWWSFAHGLAPALNHGPGNFVMDSLRFLLTMQHRMLSACDGGEGTRPDICILLGGSLRT